MPFDLPPWLPEAHLETAALLLGSVLAAYLVRAVFNLTVVAFVRNTETDLDDRIVAALGPPILASVMMVGVYLASERIGLPPVLDEAVENSLQTLAIILWGTAAFRINHAILETLARRAQSHALLQPRSLPIFEIGAKLAIVASGAYMIFVAWQIDLTAWLASAGIVGIAVGFAAKDSLANLFSGIFILADGPYRVGDYIVLDGELRGAVSHIGVRSTRILTRDDVEITIPNSVIGGAKIVNESGGPGVKQRVRVAVEAAYGSDIDLVQKVLLTCPEGVADICPDPAPQVRFREFGGSGLCFELMVWIDEPALRGRIIHDLNFSVYKGFAAASIEIPYSKHDVYIKQMPDGFSAS